MSSLRFLVIFTGIFSMTNCGKETKEPQKQRFELAEPARKFTAAEHFLPWAVGKSYRISRGPKSHSHAKETYAWDFATPTGTPIVASVDGYIRLAKGNSTTGGCSVSYSSHVKYVALYWADGSGRESIYLHLSKLPADIKVGEFVKRGTVIGYAGNTGYSCGAHLHYQVQTGAKGPNDRSTSWFLYSTWVPFAEANYDITDAVKKYKNGGVYLVSKNSIEDISNECGDSKGGLFTEEFAMNSTQEKTCSNLSYKNVNTCAKSLSGNPSSSKNLYNCQMGKIQVCKNSCLSCNDGKHDICR